MTKGVIYQHKESCTCFRCSGVAWNKGKKTGLVPSTAFKKGRNKIDLIGKQFTRLTVLSEAEDHLTPSGRRLKMYNCVCSCGKELAQYAQALRRGTVKSCGCYNRELAQKQGKANKGRKRPDVKGENNANWKGDDVGYFALHAWLKRNFDKPNECTLCSRTDFRIEWANISGQYKRDIKDFLALCRSCHYKFDRKSKEAKLKTAYGLLVDAD